MNRKKLLKTLLPLSTMPLVAFSAFALVLSSCSGNEKDTYYNTDGTNWKGYKNGSVVMRTNDDTNTAIIIGNASYEAEDLEIPSYVTNGRRVYMVTAIGTSAFDDNLLLTGSLTIDENITDIRDWAFKGCTNLTSLTLPNSLIGIGNGSFEDCTSLSGSLTIGNNIETIGFYAFQDCTGLSGTLIIPHNVKFIWGYAFDRCAGFNRLTLVNFTGVPSTTWLGTNIWGNWQTYGTIEFRGGTVDQDEFMHFIQDSAQKHNLTNWTKQTQ